MMVNIKNINGKKADVVGPGSRAGEPRGCSRVGLSQGPQENGSWLHKCLALIEAPLDGAPGESVRKIGLDSVNSNICCVKDVNTGEKTNTGLAPNLMLDWKFSRSD